MEAFPESISFGSFQLHARVDKGGMAEVFLGTAKKNADLGFQFLAIKKLLPHLNANRPFVNLLVHEAKIGVLLNHPSVASVYDLGSHKSEFFIAMEYVHGKSLDRLIQRLKETQQVQKIPLEISAYIVFEVLRGLAFAHELKDSKGRELQIVHRDISPGNILLSYRGEVKLADFGIATAEHRLQPGFTQVALGKLNYISAEQALNDPVSRASDLYSVGVIFYFLLTGKLPYQAETSEALLKRVIEGNPDPIHQHKASIAPELEAIVMKCLQRSPKNRYATAPDLFRALHEFFKNSHNIDFLSRTVRAYYQKRLGDFLKTHFEAEVKKESDIIQKAFHSVEMKNAANIKITAPQDQEAVNRVRKSSEAKSAYFDEEEDHTIFQPDYSNDSTRAIKLTADEREEFFNQAVAGTTLEPSQTEDPRNSDPVIQQAFPKLTLEQKLNMSSLEKHQKEELKDHLPKQQINSPQLLNEFEVHTFSSFDMKRPEVLDEETGPSDHDATRAMNRDEIIKDFDRIEKKLAEEKSQKTASKKTKSKTKRALKVRPDLGLSAKPKLKINLKLPKLSARSWKVVFGVSLVCVLLALGKVVSPFVGIPQASLRLLPTQKVELFFIFPSESSLSASQMIESLKSADQGGSLAQLENFFNNEYRRYSGSKAAAVRLFIQSSASQTLPQVQLENSIRNPAQVFLFFEKEMKWLPSSESNAVIYIPIFAPDYKGLSSLEPANEYLQNRSAGKGLIYGPVTTKRMAFFLSLARQIAFIYGAKDKRDSRNGLAVFPEGYAFPKEQPLYPQSKAELMGRAVPTSEKQIRDISGFHELMIGPTTAYELGWIKKSAIPK